MRLAVLASFVLLSSCSNPGPASAPGSGTRTVQGQLTGFSPQKVVAARTASGAATVAAPSQSGSFKLQVPTGEPVQLVVAERTLTGVWQATSRIGPAWFRLAPGPVVNVGLVRPGGTQRPAVASAGAAVHLCPQSPGQADLPYDAKLALGQRWSLSEAFAEKGPLPSLVVGVTMDGAGWRLTELLNNLSFTVTQADCDHVGNRGVGRDRAVITWENADGTRDSDHLDLRYCEGGGSSGATSSGGDSESESEGAEAEVEDQHCGGVEIEGCPSGVAETDETEAFEAEQEAACPGGVTGGSACTAASDCSSQLCVNGTCQGGEGAELDAGIE